MPATCEPTERADAEPGEQIDEIFEAELGLDHRECRRRQRSEERRGCFGAIT